MNADTITAIKKALEGVTHAPGKWEAEGTAVYCDDATGQRVCDTKGGYLFWSEEQKRNAAAYIAATNPVDISELLSTLESLQRENEELRKALSWAMPLAEQCLAYTMGERAKSGHTNLGTVVGTLYDSEVAERDRARTALSSTGDTHGN